MSTTKIASLSRPARLLALSGIVGTILVGSAIAFLTPLTAAAYSSWTVNPIAAQTGSFTATFDLVPTASNEEAVVGLSPVFADGFEDLAAIVRFNPSGMIDARNGG